MQSNGIALVTGGGRGLGRAFAFALAGQGMDVAIASRSSNQLDETVRLIQAQGRNALAVTADITRKEDVQALFEKVEAELGSIDLLVNNAGAGAPFGPTWELDPEQWWRNIETNLKGPFLCCDAVLPGMIQRKRGRIINVASTAGTRSIPYMSAYVTSKAAVIRFTEVLADELHEHDISVFAIQPGTVRTAMAEELLESESGQRWLPWFKTIFAEGRDSSSEAGVELVLYLASGRADALSGRFFVAPGRPADVAKHAEEVRRRDLHVLRVRYLESTETK